MLSRTADHLFWMARYVERAENTARMLDVNHQTSLLPQSEKNAEEGWRALLGISELQASYDKVHDKITARSVIDFMARDPSNSSSSIYSCIRRARENARAVRGSLTTEFWETSNATWLELNNLVNTRMLDRDPSEFFEWVKFRSHLSRGVMIGTMLKDEAFHFARMGTFLERADNTARLLDVKYHGMAELGRLVEPTSVERSDAKAGEEATSHGDFYYWAAVLRSVSAFEIYRKVYSDLITPARVAELMIPAQRHAALAVGLRQRGRHQPRERQQRSFAGHRATRRHAARGAGVRTHRPTSCRPACMPGSPTSSNASTISADASAGTSWSGTPDRGVTDRAADERPRRPTDI